MRQPEERREYADSTLLELALSDIFDSVAAGRSVPLSRDGKVVAVVVPPEVAEAGQRALGQQPSATRRVLWMRRLVKPASASR